MQATQVCSQDNCGQDGQLRRGLCRSHYNRWYRSHRVPVDTPCLVEDCDKSSNRRGWCSAHYNRWWRHGDPLIVLDNPTLLKPGNQHIQWAGDDISYSGVHRRLRAQRGRASSHSCQHCGSPAAQWAYDHTDPGEQIGKASRGKMLPYSTDLARYMPLCASCHIRLDQAAAGRG